MSRGNGRDIDRQLALFPSFSTLNRVVLRVPPWLVVQSCFPIFLPELPCQGSPGFPTFSPVQTISRTCASLRIFTCCRPGSLREWWCTFSFIILTHPCCRRSRCCQDPLPIVVIHTSTAQNRRFLHFVTIARSPRSSVAKRPFGDIFRRITPIGLNIAPPTVDIQTGFPYIFIAWHMRRLPARDRWRCVYLK
jgi:hypothetical protein